MNYLKQIWFELRERPLVTWITIGGTALSLFLLMAVYMVSRIDTLDAAPESARSRILAAPYTHVKLETGDGSASMSKEFAHRIYDDLPGVETISLYAPWNQSVRASYASNEAGNYMTKRVDADFWKIFDFEFISGTPFTPSEVEAGKKEIILSESAALSLGKGADLTGRDVMINFVPYLVKGVVRDPHPLLKNAWSQIWIALDLNDPAYDFAPETGNFGVYVLTEKGVKAEDIKKEVARRYEVYNSQIKPEKREVIYHGSPFTSEEMSLEIYSNTAPDVKTQRWKRGLLYLVLLVLPAINLSGMTRSRLRRRISEIGVRRAFGATRFNIISQLITENFLLTLIGGIIGLALCFIFVALFSNLFINYVGMWNITPVQAEASPAFGMLFTWGVFAVALILCFILNILSTGIPAIKATSENPAEAISGKHN